MSVTAKPHVVILRGILNSIIILQNEGKYIRLRWLVLQTVRLIPLLIISLPVV